MPPRPPRPCLFCGKATTNASRYCDAHQYIAEERERKARKAADERRECAARRGYGSKWRKAREGYLRLHPLCAECGRQGRVTPATVVDHIVPHRGDMVKFWDSRNWQPLCKPCHDRKTARGE
jgi:5-methylcytosine-specific restriction protein A